MPNTGLSTLLELNESIFEQEGGYWIKIDAWEVVVHDKGAPYHFQSAQQLLEDFFVEVDKLIQESKNETHHHRHHDARKNQGQGSLDSQG